MISKNIIHEKILINKYIDFLLDRIEFLINLENKKDNIYVMEFYLNEINKYLKIVVEKLNNVL